PLYVHTLLAEDPQSHIEAKSVLETCLGLLGGLKANLEANPQLVSEPQKLRQKLEEVTQILAEELRLAARKIK
ncbi:MAG: hypothetical protein V1850_03995, partial [Candidatus Bathyarchaeota archaeon]